MPLIVERLSGERLLITHDFCPASLGAARLGPNLSSFISLIARFSLSVLVFKKAQRAWSVWLARLVECLAFAFLPRLAPLSFLTCRARVLIIRIGFGLSEVKIEPTCGGENSKAAASHTCPSSRGMSYEPSTPSDAVNNLRSAT